MIGWRAVRGTALRYACQRTNALCRLARRRFSAAGTAASLAEPLTAQQLAAWNPVLALEVLQQAASEAGRVAPEHFRRLRGTPDSAEGAWADDKDQADVDAEASSDELAIVEKDGPLEQCEVRDLVRVAELCSAFKVRDFVLLQALAELALPFLKQEAPGDALLRMSGAFASLGVLNTPLFEALASALLASWPEQAGGTAATAPPASQLVLVARNFALQRVRHQQLFDRMVSLISVAELTPAEALSLLHSHAFLRLGSELGEQLWEALESKAIEPGFQALSPAALAELCYIIFLARRDSARRDDLRAMYTAIAERVPPTRDSSWTSPEGQILHRRLLLLRTLARYLHKDTFADLPDGVRNAFRQAHRMELPQREPRPVVSFVRKLSAVLTKLKIGHVCNAERGPFLFDVIERDRKLVYECNHFDRFYANSIDKIAAMCLQERVVKAMGYRVVQIPHWQWCKVKHRRQRMEYIRMSRYYAIKDRREFAPRDDMPEDIARNDFDHLGEYFFKKEAPSKSWSWFHPTYDAYRRIPSARGM